MKNNKKTNKELKEKCELCGEVSSCSLKKQKSIKIYFCPKCKSKDVGFIFTLRNVFGIIPKMRCKYCGFESAIFPQITLSKEQLAKLEKKKR